MCIPLEEFDQLRLDKDEAEASSQAKSMFMAKVGHELKTPLNAIVGLAQLIRASRGREHHADSVDGWIEQISHIGWHMAEAIDTLMELGPRGAGALRGEDAPLAVADPLAEAIRIVEHEAQRRRVSIVLVGDVGAQVRADRRALRQVFVNLLSNAVKYNREQGIVHVLVRDGARVEVSVRDSGPGLTREQIGRLFQPFERLGAEGSGVAGHGLGLLVCREFVAAMRGSIHVDSDVGLGCTFTVSLPAACVPAAVVVDADAAR